MELLIARPAVVSWFFVYRCLHTSITTSTTSATRLCRRAHSVLQNFRSLSVQTVGTIVDNFHLHITVLRQI
jgi:hypothetical protein